MLVGAAALCGAVAWIALGQPLRKCSEHATCRQIATAPPGQNVVGRHDHRQQAPEGAAPRTHRAPPPPPLGHSPADPFTAARRAVEKRIDRRVPRTPRSSARLRHPNPKRPADQSDEARTDRKPEQAGESDEVPLRRRHRIRRAVQRSGRSTSRSATKLTLKAVDAGQLARSLLARQGRQGRQERERSSSART